jgi:hypothetical protein
VFRAPTLTGFFVRLQAADGAPYLAPSGQSCEGAMTSHRTVFSLHGVNTRGAWQKEALGDALDEAGFKHVSLDYDNFCPCRLLSKKQVQAKVEWFREKYDAHTSGSNEPPSIIAHSFGTYIVARAMQLYDEICFDRIIFCGSIVGETYDWSEIIKRGQCSAVLNDHGFRDRAVGWARWAIKDAGVAGIGGFKDDANGKVLQRGHAEFTHSSYFYALNYKVNWVPFLLGNQPAPVKKAAKVPHNPRWWAIRIAAVLAVLAVLVVAGWGVMSRRGEPKIEPYKGTFSKFVSELMSARAVSAQKVREFMNNHKGRTTPKWRALVKEIRPRTERNQYLIVPENGNIDAPSVIATFSEGFDETIQIGAVIEFTGTIGDGTPAVPVIVIEDCKLIDKPDSN